jgi:hypothetical protein
MKEESGRSSAPPKAAGSRARSRSGSPSHGTVTLEVMNPRGVVVPPSVLPPTPRIAGLARKRIGLYWNGKAGADNLFDVTESLLKERFPTAEILRYEGPLEIGRPYADTIAKETDAVVYGVGD